MLFHAFPVFCANREFCVSLLESRDWSSWMRRSSCSSFSNTTASAGPQRTNWTWVIYLLKNKKAPASSLSAVAPRMSFTFTYFVFSAHVTASCFHFECLARSLMTTGHAVFPQVWRSWRFEWEARPPSGRVWHVRGRQSQQWEDP